jgi:hypothetical protein
MVFFERTITSDNDLTQSQSDSPHPIYEFPSPFLTAIAITGIPGAVLLIQRTREH